MFYMSLTTRLKDRSVHGAEDPFDHSFKFSDMADLYKSSLYVGEGFRESSIELFYQAEENLRNYMLKMLENIDFKYNFEFEELLQEFVTKSAGLDMRGQILGLIQTSMGGNNKATEQISEWISDETEDWLGKYQRRELTGNLMLPYVILYYSIQDQMRMIKEYKRLIEKLAC